MILQEEYITRYLKVNSKCNDKWQFKKSIIETLLEKSKVRHQRYSAKLKGCLGIDYLNREQVISYLVSNYWCYRDSLTDTVGNVLWDDCRAYYLTHLLERRKGYKGPLLLLYRAYCNYMIYVQLDHIVKNGKRKPGGIIKYGVRTNGDYSMDTTSAPLLFTQYFQRCCVDTSDCFYVTLENINGIATTMCLQDIDYDTALRRYKSGSVIRGVGAEQVECVIPFLITVSPSSITGVSWEGLVERDTDGFFFQREIQKKKFELLYQFELSNSEFLKECTIQRVLRDGLLVRGPNKLGEYFKRVSECNVNTDILSALW